MWLLLATSLLSPGLHAATNHVLFAESFVPGLDHHWQQVKFFDGLTDYTAVHDGATNYLHAVADKSCSAFTTKLSLKPQPHLKLSWRWRITHTPTNASDHVTARFDHAARVFIAFNTFIGPPRSLNYIWGNDTPVGTTMSHPLTSRAQLVVVESGNARAGEWISEERDVTADWKKLFDGKSMPKIEAIGVLTDADSTGTETAADYADIRLTAE